MLSRFPLPVESSVFNASLQLINVYCICNIFQPSIGEMEPPFGDAFENHTFSDQVLTSTDLLSSSSDPDFMYELVSTE